MLLDNLSTNNSSKHVIEPLEIESTGPVEAVINTEDQSKIVCKFF
jgi:hypothetical protein